MKTLTLADEHPINRPSRRDVDEAIKKVESGATQFAILEGEKDLLQFTQGTTDFHVEYSTEQAEVYESVPNLTEDQLRTIANAYLEGKDWKAMTQWSKMEFQKQSGCLGSIVILLAFSAIWAV